MSVNCNSCNKRIQKNNMKRLKCSVCKCYRHLKCTSLNIEDIDAICTHCINDIFPLSHLVSDDDFYDAVMNNDSKPHFINRKLLSDIKFELRCNLTTCSLTENDDIDIDSNYYNVLFNNPAEYYETHELNCLTPTAIDAIPQLLMHVNARSLKKKY